MIDDLINLIRAAGIAVPDTVAQNVETRLRQTYGGERVYVAHLPKQNRIQQIAKLNGLDNRQIANRTGLSIRRIQQLKKR